jgi:hypothetical protein
VGLRHLVGRLERDVEPVSTAGKPPDAARPTRRESLEQAREAEKTRAGHRMRQLRKLLFGDWTPVLRDPLDLLRLSFAFASAGFLVTGHGAIAWHMFVDFLIVVAAGRLNMPRLFDLLFILGWATQSWGNAAGLFNLNDCTNIQLGKANHVCLGYDNFVHAVIPFTSIAPVYTLGLRLGVLPDISKETEWRARLGTVLFAVLSVMSIEYLNEIWEYVAVNWLNLDLQIGYSDTIHDLALGVLGSVAGGVLLWVWAAKRWPTRREPVS